jgi:pyridoxamine 5'-phosphate oxidase
MPLTGHGVPHPRAGRDPAFLDDLLAIEQEIWWRLDEGVRERTSPFHTPTLATVSPDGPQARTVTLRRAERAARRVAFNIDARSSLAAELRAEPRVALHGYGSAERTQLRLSGSARLHAADMVASRAWTLVGASARRCYLVPPPGSPSAVPVSGLPAELEHRAPTGVESAGAFEQFTVVEISVDRIDWLYLHAQHKRRARFVWTGEQWQAGWLTP